MKKILIALVAIFSLSGCIKPEIRIVEVYVDKPVPKLKILNKVEFYQISDYRVFDETYLIINRKEFDLASDRIKKKEHKIKFYEKQNIDFNTRFVKKATDEKVDTK